MNKIKLISLSLVIAIVLMGSAFAYWSQNVNVKANVDTGFLEVGFYNCEKASGVKFWNGNEENPLIGDNDSYGNPISMYYATASFSDFENGAHEIVLNAENLFPGGAAFYTYNLKNTGTVPIEIKEVSVIPSEVTGNLGKLKLVAGLNIGGQYIATHVGTLDEIVAEINAYLRSIDTQIYPTANQNQTLWIGLDQSETGMEEIDLRFTLRFNYEQVEGLTQLPVQ